MGETLQTFVEKIRTEGVQAGRQQADELLADARKQADQIVAEAEKEKGRILAEARTDAENTLARSRTELQLAARDAALRLRDALGRALRAVLARSAKAQLSDEAFVGTVLHEIITQYGKMDLEGKRGFHVNVPEDMRAKLVDWAIAHIGAEAVERVQSRIDALRPDVPHTL